MPRPDMERRVKSAAGTLSLSGLFYRNLDAALRVSTRGEIGKLIAAFAPP